MYVFFCPMETGKKGKGRGQKIRRERKKDYPLVVDELALFLSAGITLPEAARKMTEAYEKKKEADRESPGRI